MSDANQTTRTVRGVVYTKNGTEGDFDWMRKQDKYSNTLFIFNENVCDSLDTTPHEGAGTAKLRPLGWRFQSVPRAAGIPTGWSVPSNGFKEFDFLCKKVIDASMDHVKVILRDNPTLTDIVFSCDAEDNKKLGTNIFSPHDKCLNYISAELFKLESFDASTFHKTHEGVDRLEYMLAPHAWLQYDYARLLDEHKILKRKVAQSSVGTPSKRMRW